MTIEEHIGKIIEFDKAHSENGNPSSLLAAYVRGKLWELGEEIKKIEWPDSDEYHTESVPPGMVDAAVLRLAGEEANQEP